MVESFQQLRRMSREDVERKYDDVARSTGGNINFYRDELLRRELEEQSNKMSRFTRQVRDMTIAITAMTIIVVIVTAANLLIDL